MKIKDVKPWKPKDPKNDMEPNYELVTPSSLSDQHSKDQPVAETTTTSSKGTETPLHDEGT